ncbi:MAG: hypothetical protein MJZ98_01365 [Paludibacteraceae bacterium]|nr:hypothetical protein [Paludibacteraceae bacterium]
MLNIMLNGRDLKEEWGLTAIKGTLGALLTPSQPKTLVTNSNAAINGDVVVSRARKVQSRTITLLFHLNYGGDLHSIVNHLKALEQELLNGESGDGMNRFFVQELDTTYWLCYQGMEDYTNMGESSRATLRIKFFEPNPMNNAE